MPTHGEKLVYNLAKNLPATYYPIPEPTITSNSSAYRNPDFVILAALSGVIVMEVKDYKVIRRINQDEIEIQRGTGEIANELNPVRIATKYAHNLVNRFETLEELLHQHRGKRKLKFPWVAVAVLPHISCEWIRECETTGIWDEGQVLGKEDLLTPETFEQALQRVPWKWRLTQSLTPDTISIVRGALKPEIVVKDVNDRVVGVLTPLQDKLVHESPKSTSPTQKAPLNLNILTEENIQIAEITSVRLVRGVAGSGKSLVLARRAQFLAEQSSDSQVLVLAFNVDLVADLQHRIPGHKNLEIINFHKMCSRILGNRWRSPTDVVEWLENHVSLMLTQSGLTSEFVADEIEWRKEFGVYDGSEYLAVERKGRGKSLSAQRRNVINQIFDQYVKTQETQGAIDWGDVPFMALKGLTSGHYLSGHYDAILIDEAQDFAPSWLAVVKQLLKPDGSLFLCDDPMQSIFRLYSWKEKGIDVVGRTRRLNVPFRSSREIGLAAHALINSDMSQSDQDEETVIPEFDLYELTSGEVPILSQFDNQTHEFESIRKAATDILQSGMNGSRIAVLCHDKRLVKSWDNLARLGIYVNSFRRMKGLEFDVVFVPSLQAVFTEAERITDETVILKKRRRLFTAMTRAREKLFMSYYGQFPPELSVLMPYISHKQGTG